jgi:hypothetical protein
MTERSGLAGSIAHETILQSIGSGAGICARVGGAIWKRAAYVNPYTGEIGIFHQIMRGREGTAWNKFYGVITGINISRTYALIVYK